MITTSRSFNPEQPYGYMLWRDGPIYYAKNGHTGAVISYNDASTMWQTYIDATATTGKSIYAKSAIYEIPRKLAITHPVNIIGEIAEFGGETHGVELLATAAMTSIIEVNVADVFPNNIETAGNLQNLVLNGNSNTNADACLHIKDGVRMKYTNIHGIYGKVWGLLDEFNHSHSYYDCQFGYSGSNATAESGGAKLGTATETSCNATVFTRCNFEANLQRGLFIHNGNTLTFNGCVIEGNYSYGVYGENSYNQTWITPHFESNNTQGSARAANFFEPNIANVTMISPYFGEAGTGTTYSLYHQGYRLLVLNPACTGGVKIYLIGDKMNGYIGNGLMFTLGAGRTMALDTDVAYP